MQDYRKLVVWQRAHRLVLSAYQVLQHFPPHERYELTSQLRRALVSVPTNLVEGRSRRSAASFAAFIDVAAASAAEVEYLLLLARDLGYVDDTAHAPLSREIDEIRRMLAALWSQVNTRVENRTRRRPKPPSLNANG
jgi:four helix bundle protein